MRPLEEDVAVELAFGDAFGACVLVGDVPDTVVAGAAAAATGLVLAGPVARQADLLADAASWVETVASPDELDGYEEPFGSVVFWNVPDDVGDWLEAALRAVGHDAVVQCVQEEPDRGVAKRWARLVEASCQPDSIVLGEERPGWIVVRGRRRRLDVPATELVAADALPMSIVAVVEGHSSESEQLLVDVLLRQNHPAAELFVVDTGGAGGPVPDNLYGFAASPPPRVVLVPTGDLGVHETINDALGAVSQPFVGILPAGERIAANHHAELGMLLERTGAPVVSCGMYGARGLMVDRGALLEARGLNPSVASPLEDLRVRLGGPVECPIPVAASASRVG